MEESVVAESRGESDSPASTFTAWVTYVQPVDSELQRRFPAYVNPGHEGFMAIGWCKNVSRENRKVEFQFVHMDREASTDLVFSEMERRGLRPALYEELLGFALEYPDEQRRNPIVALGSITFVRTLRRHVAFLTSTDNGRKLDMVWFDGGWNGDCRFLVVRKDA